MVQNIDELLLECKKAFKANDLIKMNDICLKALNHSPSNAEALHLFGVLKHHQGKIDDAIEYFSKSLVSDPNAINVRISLAFLFFHQKDKDNAFRQYLTAFAYLTGFRGELDIAELFLAIVNYLFSGGSMFRKQNTVHLQIFGLLAAEFCAHLKRDGIYNRIIELSTENINNPELGQVLDQILPLLAFNCDASYEWKRDTFSKCILPVMELFVDNEKYNYALYLESKSYTEYIKRKETEASFRESYFQINKIMERGGLKLRERFDDSEFAYAKLQNEKRIAIFIHVASLLAHVELVLNTIEGYRNTGDNSAVFKVYVMTGKNTDMESRFRDVGVEIEWLSDYKGTNNDRYILLLLLRTLIIRDKMTAVVWTSLANYLVFSFAMKVAPVQIWWAMKYHGMDSEVIDGYVASYSITKYKEICGRQWRTARHGIKDWYDPSLEVEAKQLRNNMFSKYTTVLASLGREEKLDSAEFINAVCDILEGAEDSCFLWTGRKQISSIQSIFDRRGLADRCFFIGWVNTRLYAQVIDVFLDSFPFPCGFTAFQAMAAGKPVIFYSSDESYETGIYGLINPVLDGDQGSESEIAEIRELFSFGSEGKRLFPAAKTQREYIDLSIEVISDKTLSSKISNVNKRFVVEQVSSPEKMAKEYVDHFKEIIYEKLD